MKTVRIQRKRKSDTQMLMAWGNVFLNITRRLAQPYIDQERAVIQDAKLEEIRIRTRVALQREASLSNDVVLKDLKIEEQQLRIALLRRELEVRGLNPDGTRKEFAPESS